MRDWRLKRSLDACLVKLNTSAMPVHQLWTTVYIWLNRQATLEHVLSLMRFGAESLKFVRLHSFRAARCMCLLFRGNKSLPMNLSTSKALAELPDQLSCM